MIGLDVGLSFTAKSSPILGVGADIAYHYWPVSAEFKQKYNESLDELLLGTLKLGGETWGLQVLQLGAHFRVGAPVARGVRPWLQIGASAYRVNPNTTGFSGNAGFFTVTAPPLKPTMQFGCSVSIGADLFSGRYARAGLDATYHYVDCSRQFGENLKMITLGAHSSFDW